MSARSTPPRHATFPLPVLRVCSGAALVPKLIHHDVCVFSDTTVAALAGPFQEPVECDERLALKTTRRGN